MFFSVKRRLETESEDAYGSDGSDYEYDKAVRNRKRRPLRSSGKNSNYTFDIKHSSLV